MTNDKKKDTGWNKDTIFASTCKHCGAPIRVDRNGKRVGKHVCKPNIRHT